MIEIPLTQGQVAFVDDEDAALAHLRWYAEKREQTFYATRNLPKMRGKSTGVIRLHQAVMGEPQPGMEIDHINRNGLDCRRSVNLRFVTKKQNHANRGACQTKTSTRFKGVFWRKRRRVWEAAISVNRRQLHLGTFDTDEAAARAYDAAAQKHFGEYARLNFP